MSYDEEVDDVSRIIWAILNMCYSMIKNWWRKNEKEWWMLEVFLTMSIGKLVSWVWKRKERRGSEKLLREKPSGGCESICYIARSTFRDRSFLKWRCNWLVWNFFTIWFWNGRSEGPRWGDRKNHNHIQFQDSFFQIEQEQLLIHFYFFIDIFWEITSWPSRLLARRMCFCAQVPWYLFINYKGSVLVFAQETDLQLVQKTLRMNTILNWQKFEMAMMTIYLR